MSLENNLHALGFTGANSTHPGPVGHPLLNHTPLSAALNIMSGAFKLGGVENRAFGEQLLKQLVEYGASDFLRVIPCYGNMNAVGLAAALGLENAIKLMVLPEDARGCNPDLMEGVAGGYSPLTFASINAKTDVSPCRDVIAHIVSNNYAAVDELNYCGDTALQLAGCNNALGGVKSLISFGADVNLPFTPSAVASPMNTGRTPFMLACNAHKNIRLDKISKSLPISPEDSFIAVARVISENGTLNIDLKSADGNTYLHYAAMINDETLMRSVELKYQVRHPEQSLVNVHNSASPQNVIYGTLCSDATPLNAAASELVYSLSTVKTLVAMGSDVNSTFTKHLNAQKGAECTNFTAACQGAYYAASAPIKAEFVSKAEYFLTLEAFTNYNITDSDGFNSIHWALSLGSAKLVHVLLEKMKVVFGEDRCKSLLNADDNAAKSSMDWAVEEMRKAATDVNKQEYIDIITELKFHGSKVKPIHKSEEMTAIIKDTIHHHDSDLLLAYQLGGLTIDPDADLYD